MAFPRIIGLGLLSAAALISLLGCSVKEDRADCPCELRLDCARACRSGESSLTIRGVNGVLQNLSLSDTTREIRFLVPKERVELFCASPVGYVSRGGGVQIEYGKDCPEVFLCASQIDCTGESAEYEVYPHKVFSRLKLSVVMSSASVGWPFRVAVVGNVCGFDSSAQPIRGLFRCEKSASADGSFEFLLPRQNDDSLMLEVLTDDRAFKSFALGQYLLSSGFDWTEDDLEDVDLELNLSRVGLSLTVSFWDKSEKFECVL